MMSLTISVLVILAGGVLLSLLSPVFYMMLAVVIILAWREKRAVYAIALAVLFGMIAYALQWAEFRALGVMIGWLEPLAKGLGMAISLLFFAGITRVMRCLYIKRRSLA
ncbi:hypothetical protein [Rhizobium sp. P44RR-XXIV]|uniref:hypothetical protein n=1 Tax=Rhizobium sp. P44RR-XXIV TaxID=1921145 RepID=UPI0010AA6CD6|nr:hypothetical protein [Rhizobium sp. P44RR-XXIV]TIX89463.1 hypothetical protein BSK43_023090 [Rhizobium sp. P44RR-XXIV]